MALLVRLADWPDEPELFLLAREFYEEFQGEAVFLPYDEDKAAQVIHRAIAKQLALLVEDRGRIVGALVLDDYAPFYSHTYALWDMSFYVRPEARKSRAAVLLRDTAKAIAADLGMRLCLGVSTGSDLDRKDKFFTRAGFKRIGALYLWE